MKYLKKLTAVLMIVFMVYTLTNINRVERVWPKWLKGKHQSYYGNINLWHINDDFSQKIPYENMFKKFEKNNFGIFVNVSYMTADEAKMNMSTGNYPDMVTYSQNPFDKPEELLAELEKTENSFLDKGRLHGELLAYPLYYDTYTLIINEEIVAGTGEDIPAVIEPEYVVNTLTKLNYPEDVVPFGITRAGGALYISDAVGETAGELNCKDVNMRDFEKGKVAVMVCSSLELEGYGAELPACSAYQFSGFTDRCRYMSVLKSDDKNKLKYCQEIAELLMSEKYQKQISEHGFSTLYGHAVITTEKDVQIKGIFENN